jgi:hypothetical protein
MSTITPFTTETTETTEADGQRPNNKPNSPFGSGLPQVTEGHEWKFADLQKKTCEGVHFGGLMNIFVVGVRRIEQ